MAAIIINPVPAGTEVAGNTKPPHKCRAWFVTLNNPTEAEELAFAAEDTEYSIYQIERGEEKTVHLQGFLYYKHARVWPKGTLARGHFEKAFSIPKSIEYCSKVDTRVRGPYEKGVRPKQGDRTDLKALGNKIMAGASLADLARENPEAVIKYSKGLEVLIGLSTAERKEKPSVIWVWGPPGSGKTRWVHERHASLYIKDGTQWWNGYSGQDAILIDDFDGKWPVRDLLRLLDRYAYQGQTKGGYVKITSPHIYITCDRHWRAINWAGDGVNLVGQVERRLTGKKECLAVPGEVHEVPDV